MVMVLMLMSAQPALGQQPGWHFSPLPGEGDRASTGCASDSTPEDFTCLAVRCEEDFSTGIHIYASRPEGVEGQWELTLDRETRSLAVIAAQPYGGRFEDEDGWLMDGLRHGTFVYLRHEDDADGAFAHISLAGSFRAIEEALQWCAPRVPRD